MRASKIKETRRQRRHKRIRAALKGTAERPRLAVFRSINHIYAQLIDDEQGRTLAASSTLDPQVRKVLKASGNKTAAEAVGKDLAKKASAAGIKKAAFDRGGFKYHGRIRALADAARADGLEF